MNEWVGKMLGKVRIDSLIARGGMAEVYLGTHTTLQREVAVKILRNQYEDDEDLLERFQREARVVAKLRHQNIVQVFDYDAIDERPYIVMEYVSGPSLSKYLSVLSKTKGKLELPEISRILVGVANALQYAHNSGVIHRDIKPGNIILTSHSQQVKPGLPLPQDFEPVLTDFGLVRFLNSSRQTSAGQTAGTPAYMSPEQARGETTDGRTDIYSLGIVLYEMLTGKVPFDGETTMSILLKHISEPPPPIPGLSNPIQKVLDKALAKNKEERFQKPSEFAKAFQAVVNTETETEQSTFMGISPVVEPVAIEVAEPVDSIIIVNSPPSQPRGRIFTVALAILTLALLGVIYFVSSGATSSPPATNSPTASPPLATNTKSINPFSTGLGSTAILHFRDGSAIMDQVVVEALAMPAPPIGNQYEAWLVGSESRLGLGTLLLDPSGKGSLTYDAPQQENLLMAYDRVEITTKPNEANTSDLERLAYAYTLPSDGLVYLRQLLVSSADIPGQAPVIQTLSSDTQLLAESIKDMLNAYANNDLASTKKHGESILNLLVGNQGPEYQDWNKDGRITDQSDGYGFLQNGTNLGYLQVIFAQAGYAANSFGASQNMILHGNEIKICAENLALWTASLKEELIKIVSGISLAEIETPVKEAGKLAEQIWNGIDLDENGNIETLPGECGVVSMYTAAYAMADMPLLPLGFGTPTAVGSGTPSPIGTFFTATPTNDASGGGGGSSATQAPHVPPGQQRTREPKPTHSGGGGGGGGNGGGGSNGGGNGGGNNGQP